MEIQNQEWDLPENDYAEGFSYLFDMLSHLTQSRRMFSHKLSILIGLSRETNTSQFTRAEIGSLFPQYDARVLDNIISTLIEGTWLNRIEGTLSYSLTRTGLLFLRLLPFLYHGDEMDETSFQMAMGEMLDAAGKMELGLPSLELMRDQFLYAVQRNTVELTAALISRNDERIRKTVYSIRAYLVNVDGLIKRISDITHYKQQKGLELNAADLHGIETLLSFNSKVMSVYGELSQYYLDHNFIGPQVFTKYDVDRLLSKTSFEVMSLWIGGNLATPSRSSWMEEEDLIMSLETFLQKSRTRKKSRITPKLKVPTESIQHLFGVPYSEKLTDALSEYFRTNSTLTLEGFLTPYTEKVDGLMFLAALSSLEHKEYLWKNSLYAGYHLQAEPQWMSPENHLFSLLSRAEIHRKERVK